MSNIDFPKQEPTEPRFKAGDIVLIKRVLVGMVISSQWYYTSNGYKILINAWDGCYRLINHPTTKQDRSLFNEDMSTLLYDEHVQYVGFHSDEKDIELFSDELFNGNRFKPNNV